VWPVQLFVQRPVSGLQYWSASVHAAPTMQLGLHSLLTQCCPPGHGTVSEQTDEGSTGQPIAPSASSEIAIRDLFMVWARALSTDQNVKAKSVAAAAAMAAPR
jgi:hypothetical protein